MLTLKSFSTNIGCIYFTSVVEKGKPVLTDFIWENKVPEHLLSLSSLCAYFMLECISEPRPGQAVQSNIV